MEKIKINTTFKKYAADLYTPVGIYLRLRDRFRDTILLESTDAHAGENSRSVIAINAICGIEINDLQKGEYKFPGEKEQELTIDKRETVPSLLNKYLDRFDAAVSEEKVVRIAAGLFGYTSYDAVQFFDTIQLSQKPNGAESLPLLRYRLYQYVIVIDHFKDELYLCENHVEGIESNIGDIESILKSKDIPQYAFDTKREELSDNTDEEYKAMVQKGIDSCMRGDVFQIVLSRRFQQGFTGDEFNVYRALRSINPGPYLFYFDYGDYRIMGSSPEAQVIISEDKVILHPIAGTFRRTGNDETDRQAAVALEADAKENAEHVMLVDLARNDLSRVCKNVQVTKYKNINFYSHVIHMVSEVQGDLAEEKKDPFKIMGSSFPAGTLSGAPKYKAMQLIDGFEKSQRSFYGGAIGWYGFDKTCNHAIMIRTFLSMGNVLTCRAGAGVVAASVPQSEMEEVNNKLQALKKAIALARTITA